MAKAFTIKIDGIKDAQRAFDKLARESPKLFARVLFQFMEEKIAGESQENYVPVVTGTLKTSIHTQLPVVIGKSVSVTVGAGGAAAPYAVSVHENPRTGKTEGVSPSGKPYYAKPGLTRSWSKVGQWKFLEVPALKAAGDPRQLIQDIKSEFERLAYGSR